MPFVVDASVTLSWCFEDESNPYSDGVLDAFADDIAVVPGVWTLEVANGLVVAERRGRLTEAQTIHFAGLLSSLPIEIEVEEIRATLAAVIPIARDHGLSAYDAAYVDLAARRGVPLATLDDRLRAGAVAAGVAIHGA